MAKTAKTIRELAQVRANNRDLLNAIVGVQGTALGLKNYGPDDSPVGDPCIIVYVPHKIHDALLSDNIRIPRELTSADGSMKAPTDVVVTTFSLTDKSEPVLSPENVQLVEYLQWRDGKLDHLPSGAQIGTGAIVGQKIGGFVGTLGFAVRLKSEKQRVGLLTNQHVGVHSGHSLYIPGYRHEAIRIGITRQVVEHRADDQWLKGIDEKFAYIRTDAAFVLAEENIDKLLRNEVPGANGAAMPPARMGKPFNVELESMKVIGMHVKKVGRTTGLQRGTIVAFGYGIPSEEEFIDRRIGKEPANIYTDFLIAPRGDSTIFSAKGDSGSAILIDSPESEIDNCPIGLLWGGGPMDIGREAGLEDLTFGIALDRILDTLDLELV